MAEGERADGVCAFVRRAGDEWALAAACIRPVSAEAGWGDTAIRVPGTVRNVLTGAAVPAHEGRVRVGDLFAMLPVALLERG